MAVCVCAIEIETHAERARCIVGWCVEGRSTTITTTETEAVCQSQARNYRIQYVYRIGKTFVLLWAASTQRTEQRSIGVSSSECLKY